MKKTIELKNRYVSNTAEEKKDIEERSMKSMDKKTKNIIKAATAAAAVITTGLIIGAAPAYAQENCSCNADSHSEECGCGCMDMKEELAKAQKEYYAANEASEKAANEKVTAEKQLNKAEESLNDAKEALKKEIDGNKNAAKDSEEEAHKKVNDATEEYTRLEKAEKEASDAAEKSKETAETAAKVESGELALEDIHEYNAVINDERKLEEISVQKETLGKKISVLEEKVASDKEKTDSLKKRVSDKESDVAQRQEIIDKSSVDRETVLKEYNNLKKELDSLKKEEEALKKSVADKMQLKENAADAKNTSIQAYDKAFSENNEKNKAMDAAKKSLDEYNETAEKKRNSADLFRWLLTRDDLSSSLRDSAEFAVKVLTGTPDENTVNEGVVSYDAIMKSTKLGDKDDATHLENVKIAVDYVEEGNGRRDMENTGLEHLLITPRLMAFAELNANYMSKNNVLVHTDVFPASENAASGFDFFYMWYDLEKAEYEAKGDQAVWDDVGHYLTLVSPLINLTGFGYNGYYASHTFYGGAEEDGYTVEEFRRLIKDYEGFLDGEKDRLQKAYNAAQNEYRNARVRLDNAIDEKQKAEDALKEAEYALSDLLSKQKQNADALNKSEQSIEKYVIALDETGEKLKEVIEEKDRLENELDLLKAELKEAVEAYVAEMKSLAVDKEKYEALAFEYDSTQNKLHEDREILSLIQDADAALKNYESKKEKHRLVNERLESAVAALNTLRKEYEDKKKAYETAQKLSFEEVLSSDDEVYAQFSQAIEAVKLNESKYSEAREKYEKSLEALNKAQEEVNIKKENLDKVLLADSSLRKLCETHEKSYGHIATPADVTGVRRHTHYKGGAVSVARANPTSLARTQAAQTGDNSALPLWVSVSALSAIAIGFTVFRKKRAD